jgi:hypothetical protein
MDPSGIKTYPAELMLDLARDGDDGVCPARQPRRGAAGCASARTMPWTVPSGRGLRWKLLPGAPIGESIRITHGLRNDRHTGTDASGRNFHP